MKNNTGFTLIELLAVIVILAIILIIAVPLISGVIESAKKSAFTSSASMIAKTAENSFLKNQLEGNNNPIRVVFSGGVITEGNLAFSGEKPESGTIVVNNKGKVGYALYSGKFCSEKSFLDDTAITTEADEVDCVFEEPVPIVTLIGNATIEVLMGQPYTEPGVTAVDENGEVTTNITTEITKDGGVVASIDTSVIGTYIVKYIATGEALTGEITRTINIIDSCGTDFTDVRDGKTYSTVRLGTQCWFAEDARYTGNGCLSNSMTTPSVIGCRDNGSVTYPSTYYQWSAAMNYTTTEGGQGICPAGWHIPSDAEWKTMEVYLGMSVADSNLASTWRNSGNVNQQLKTSVWGGNNSSGMTIVPAGYGWNSAVAGGSIGNHVFYWTSTQISASNAWDRNLSLGFNGVNRVNETKTYAFSIRCVMN